MKIDVKSIKNAFSPGIMARAIKTFDKSTAIIVMSCWGGAILLIAFAFYTLTLTMNAKREMSEAMAREPSLPRIITGAPDAKEIQPLIERLQKRYPDISFVFGKDKTLTVSTTSVGNFRLWLTVLGYIDTSFPQYRWSIKEFCVGMKCENKIPMKAVLTAEKISFIAPEKQ